MRQRFSNSTNVERRQRAARTDHDAAGLVEVSKVESVRERFYAISAERRLVHPAERRLVHPAALAIRTAARDDLFA